jgi:molybdopterin-synthase adenylyltransferase
MHKLSVIRSADLGRPKVEATAQLCRSIHPEAVVTAVPHRFARSSVQRLELAGSGGQAAATEPVHLACFACVDSITTRRLLWDVLRHHTAFWVDGRMAAETLRVLASGSPPADEFYAGTLFDSSHAYAGACSARSTIYTASIAAGLMLSQFARWLRHVPVERDQLLNLLACELTTP